jgi:hypothetical protein
MGGQWSTYWYNGYIYGAEIARGVDVFKLVPNQFLTQGEIDAANQVHFNELNVQNQPKITWPSNFIVARAYVDQLERSGALPAARISAVTAAMEKGNRGQLQSLAKGLEKDSAGAKTAADRERMRALAGILKAARR